MDGTKEVALVGNLYASNVERNPVFKLNTSGVVVNNVIANPGQRAIHTSVPDETTGDLPKAKISVVGNVVLHGDRSKPTSAIFEGTAEGYFKDNEGWFWDGKPLPLLRKPFDTLPEPPVWPQGLQAQSPASTLWHVTRFAGARPAERDAIDQRIIRESLTAPATSSTVRSRSVAIPASPPWPKPWRCRPQDAGSGWRSWPANWSWHRHLQKRSENFKIKTSNSKIQTSSSGTGAQPQIQIEV